MNEEHMFRELNVALNRESAGHPAFTEENWRVLLAQVETRDSTLEEVGAELAASEMRCKELEEALRRIGEKLQAEIAGYINVEDQDKQTGRARTAAFASAGYLVERATGAQYTNPLSLQNDALDAASVAREPDRE